MVQARVIVFSRWICAAILASGGITDTFIVLVAVCV
jgi:hypothetical protein